MGLGPKPKAQVKTIQPTEFNPEEGWKDLAGYLEHEREFWPGKHLGFLSDHLAALSRALARNAAVIDVESEVFQ